jgi:SpoIID/LytB domain protein
MVLLRDGGGLVDVRYSATCGGHGEDNEAIWGGDADPSLRGRRDDVKGGMSKVTDIGAFLAEDPSNFWCGRVEKSRNRFRWTEKISADDVTVRVATEYPEVGRVKTLTAKQRGVSGRVQVLTIGGDKASVDVSGDLKIRRLLGGLKSTLFDVKREGNTFVFNGAGFGHGVGMCQLGAIGMAEAGKTNAQILEHYYRGTHLHRLY